MENTAAREDGYVQELTDDEARELFDQAAQFYLGVSGEEFLKLWESGQYDDPDQPEIMNVAMLLPFVQPE
jgi:hypothetical protein